MGTHGWNGAKFQAQVNFYSHIRDRSIQLDDVTIAAPSDFFGVEDLARTYSLDLVDALQLRTILHGRFCNLSSYSRTLLVTADKALAEAARQEGAAAWYCLDEPVPEH